MTTQKTRRKVEKNLQTPIAASGSYRKLVSQIGTLLAESRKQVFQAVNTTLVNTYWQIGRHIVEFEQGGKAKAQYGAELLDNLAKDLTAQYGKGFSRSNLFQVRMFYLKFPKIQTLSGKLSWSHYTEIIKADSDLEIGFYTKQCENENWSVRELKRQMKSLLFHRIALSKDKKGVLEISREGVQTQKPEDIVKDPYVLEFLGVNEEQKYLEGDIEEMIVLLEKGGRKELLWQSPVRNEPPLPVYPIFYLWSYTKPPIFCIFTPVNAPSCPQKVG